jgi:hypothetical protein
LVKFLSKQTVTLATQPDPPPKPASGTRTPPFVAAPPPPAATKAAHSLTTDPDLQRPHSTPALPQAATSRASPYCLNTAHTGTNTHSTPQKWKKEWSEKHNRHYYYNSSTKTALWNPPTHTPADHAALQLQQQRTITDLCVRIRDLAESDPLLRRDLPAASEAGAYSRKGFNEHATTQLLRIAERACVRSSSRDCTTYKEEVLDIIREMYTVHSLLPPSATTDAT